MIDFTGIDAKIERAKRHLAEVKEEVNAIVAASGQHVARDDNGHPTHYIYRARNVAVFPRCVSVIIGDFLVNLRGALDHLAWQLVLEDKGTPSKKTSFRINESPLNAKGNSVRSIVPTLKDPVLRDAVEKVQPYSRTHNRPDGPAFDHLAFLRRLCNDDKHKLLLVVSSGVDPGSGWWGISPDNSVAHRIYFGPAKEGMKVAEFSFTHNPGPHFDPHLALHVHLLDCPPDVELVDFLGHILFAVEIRVVEYVFKAIAEGRPPLFV